MIQISIDAAAQLILTAGVITDVILIVINTLAGGLAAAGIVTDVIQISIDAVAQLLVTIGIITQVIAIVVNALTDRLQTAQIITDVILVDIAASTQNLVAAGVVTQVILVAILAVAQLVAAAGVVTDVILIVVNALADGISTTCVIADVILIVVLAFAQGRVAAVAQVIVVGITHVADALSEDRIVSSFLGGSGQRVQNLAISAGAPAGKGVNSAAILSLGGSARIHGNRVVGNFHGLSLTVDDPADLNVGGGSNTVAMALGVPQIVDIAVGKGSACGGCVGQDKSAVAVLQPDGVHFHEVINTAGAVQAEGELFEAGAVLQNEYTGLFGGDNRRTAADRQPGFGVGGNSRVNKAVADDRTVNIDHHVLQIGSGALIAAGGGRVGSSNQGLFIEHILAPVFQVPHINVVTAGLEDGQIVKLAIGDGPLPDHQSGILGNCDLHTGQQMQILPDLSGSGVDVDRDIAVQGQDEGGGIDLGGADELIHGIGILSAGQIQCDTGHGSVAIDIHDQAVSGRIVILDDGAAGGIEHTAAADELHGQAHAQFSGGNGHCDVNILGSAGIQRNGDFDVLHIILGEGEGLDVVIGGVAVAVQIRIRSNVHKVLHIRATGEVSDLHDLVDLGAGVGGNGTVAVNETPSIQVGAVVHGNVTVGAHVDSAVGTAGTTAVGTLGATLQCGVLGLNVQSTVDGQLCTLSQSQGHKGIGSNRLGNGILGGDTKVGIVGFGEGICGIHGNQQGDARRNGVAVFIGCQSTALHQRDLDNAVGLGIGHGFVQVGIVVFADQEHRCVLGDDHCLNGSGLLHVAGICSLSGNVLTGGDIVPAHELVFGTGVGSQGVLHTGHIGDHLRCSACIHGNTLVAVSNGVAAVGGSLKGGIHSAAALNSQSQLGDIDVDLVGTGAALNNVQHDGNAFTASQLLAEGTGGSSLILCAIYGNIAVLRSLRSESAGDFIIKAQLCFAALIVGDGQRIRRSQVQACGLRSTSKGAGHSVFGAGPGTGRSCCAVGYGHADGLVCQAAEIDSGYCVDGIIHRRQNTDDHNQSQDQCRKPFHRNFHSFHPFVDSLGMSCFLRYLRPPAWKQTV